MDDDTSVLMICTKTGEIRMKRFGTVKDLKGFVRRQSKAMGANLWQLQTGDQVVFDTTVMQELLAKL